MRTPGSIRLLVALVACLTASACAPAQWIGEGPGESQTYRVRGKSTLLDVARHYDLGYVEVVAANPGVPRVLFHELQYPGDSPVRAEVGSMIAACSKRCVR